MNGARNDERNYYAESYIALIEEGEKKPFELMKELGMTKPTFYRYKNQIEKEICQKGIYPR